MLEPVLRDRILQRRDDLSERGALLNAEQLSACYATFREQFGPERLQALSGERLLTTMHAHGSQDSLVYWLEFRNDEALPAAFGSIGGGSALKFGIYRSLETGEWRTGSSRNQRTLSVLEAIAVAERHRDELVAAAAVLEALPVGAAEAEYEGLQRDIERVAPTVADTAWGHKYLTLLFPTKLDQFHAGDWQRFHLIKLLQEPPAMSGRFVAAGKYVALADELGMHLQTLATVLRELNGSPHRYWRIGTLVDGATHLWPLIREEGIVAVGWDRISDQSALTADAASKETLRAQIQDAYGGIPTAVGRSTQQLFNFITAMTPGDLVIAANGERVLGIGRITGDYQYDTGQIPTAPHRRPVQWLSTEEWKLPVSEGLQTTVHPVQRHVENLVAIERHIVSGVALAPAPARRPTAIQLDGVPGRLQAILKRKGQAILYGPPGTGKTYWARAAALDLAAVSAFGQRYGDLSESERAVIHGAGSTEGLVRMCTFHPAYGYEDFLEGYRPVSVNGSLSFECRDGIFKRLCADAERTPERLHVLLIDEINRGDIPRIFGELLTLLELDKRGIPITLPLSGDRFTVPPNVTVIGTMNTADRSIALLDTALRRRFGFVELMPDPLLLKGVVVGGSLPLGPWLVGLNERIRQYVGRDARNLQVGHAFLLRDGKPLADFSSFVQVLAEDIIPLVEEYCYEDYSALAKILGSGLVDEAGQRLREELFGPEQHDELLHALLAPTPDLVTTRSAVETDGGVEQMEEDEDNNEADNVETAGE